MSFPDTALTDAFRRLAPQPVRTAQAVRPATVNFVFGGGGQALVAGAADPLLIEIPFPCRIVWAHMYAGDVNGQPASVTASLDLRLTQFGTFGSSLPLYGSGAAPALAAAPSANISLAGWHIDLDAGDAIIARILTFSGLATWLALTLQLRPTEVPVTANAITDAAGDIVVDASGNVVVLGG